MAHHDDEDPLPATWPFRFAATLLIAALVWFTLGMGLHDVGEELPNYMPIFFALLLTGLAFVLGGAVYNTALNRGRSAKG
jgi:undecaprenyl pyrophosphate phosphatase UppP